jgi:hypothetical protein
MKNSDIRAFALATAQRVVRTFAQTLLALLVADQTDIISTPWTHDLAIAAMAAVLALLTCLAGGATSGAGPAFGKTEITSPPASPHPAMNAHHDH